VLWRCWLGGRKGIRPVKNWAVGCWHGYLSGAKVQTCIWTADATVSCFSKIQTGFTFLVPAHPGRPGQRAVKRLCVCLCVDVNSLACCNLHSVSSEYRRVRRVIRCVCRFVTCRIDTLTCALFLRLLHVLSPRPRHLASPLPSSILQSQEAHWVVGWLAGCVTRSWFVHRQLACHCNN